MKIKTKLHLGFSFLFLMMLFFGAFAGYYLKDIADSSKVILRDNYETLNILKELRRIVDNQDLPLSKISAERLEMLLKKQEKNITEKGEADLTALIRRDFELLKTNTSNDTEQRGVIRDLRNNITQIEELNMRAIVRKNDRAQNSVKEANLYLQIIGSFIIIILFSFIVNIPGFIADPLF
ncbi:MAG: MCP four helix bundle domain-containing protein, partial [Daejeonella sp.]